jgi:hypothetical protein
MACCGRTKDVLNIGLYVRNELLLMLERAEFTDVIVHGDDNDSDATSDDDFLASRSHERAKDPLDPGLAERPSDRLRPHCGRPRAH